MIVFGIVIGYILSIAFIALLIDSIVSGIKEDVFKIPSMEVLELIALGLCVALCLYVAIKCTCLLIAG